MKNLFFTVSLFLVIHTLSFAQLGNTSFINTQGNENEVSVSQTGSNSAEINQGMAGLGDAFEGEAIVVQDGTNNTARTNQNGSRNSASTFQTALETKPT